MQQCDVFWLGCIAYDVAWDLQRRMADEVAAGVRPPTCLLLEHPHIYIMGRRTGEGHLLWDTETLACEGIAVREVGRGGDITYPILYLTAPAWQGQRLPQVDFTAYIRHLELILIRTLSDWGVNAYPRAGLTGVWVDMPEHLHTAPGDDQASCRRPCKNCLNWG
jgi:lipoyl(octanoyl) transferase